MSSHWKTMFKENVSAISVKIGWLAKFDFKRVFFDSEWIAPSNLRNDKEKNFDQRKTFFGERKTFQWNIYFRRFEFVEKSNLEQFESLKICSKLKKLVFSMKFSFLTGQRRNQMTNYFDRLSTRLGFTSAALSQQPTNRHVQRSFAPQTERISDRFLQRENSFDQFSHAGRILLFVSRMNIADFSLRIRWTCDKPIEVCSWVPEIEKIDEKFFFRSEVHRATDRRFAPKPNFR